MSTLAPHYRPNGRLRTSIGTGPLVDPVEDQGLRLDSAGSVYCNLDGVIDHHCAGLPFDVDGRLVITASPVDYWDQGIPFAATGAVTISQLLGTYVDQGLAFEPTGTLVRN